MTVFSSLCFMLSSGHEPYLCASTDVFNMTLVHKAKDALTACIRKTLTSLWFVLSLEHDPYLCATKNILNMILVHITKVALAAYLRKTLTMFVVLRHGSKLPQEPSSLSRGSSNVSLAAQQPEQLLQTGPELLSRQDWPFESPLASPRRKGFKGLFGRNKAAQEPSLLSRGSSNASMLSPQPEDLSQRAPETLSRQGSTLESPLASPRQKGFKGLFGHSSKMPQEPSLLSRGSSNASMLSQQPEGLSQTAPETLSRQGSTVEFPLDSPRRKGFKGLFSHDKAENEPSLLSRGSSNASMLSQQPLERASSKPELLSGESSLAESPLPSPKQKGFKSLFRSVECTSHNSLSQACNTCCTALLVQFCGRRSCNAFTLQPLCEYHLHSHW